MIQLWGGAKITLLVACGHVTLVALRPMCKINNINLILILFIIVMQNLILNYRAQSLNIVLVNFNLEINIVHVTTFIVNCCVCVDDLYIVLSLL